MILRSSSSVFFVAWFVVFSGTGQKYTISKQNKFSLKPRGINIPAETLSLNDCVIISSTFPPINNQQTCFAIKAVLRKNMSAGIGREFFD